MRRREERLNINDWCTRYGLKINNPIGFKGKRSQIWNKKYFKREFENGVRGSYIVVHTEKGLDFLNNIIKGVKI